MIRASLMACGKKPCFNWIDAPHDSRQGGGGSVLPERFFCFHDACNQTGHGLRAPCPGARRGHAGDVPPKASAIHTVPPRPPLVTGRPLA